MPLGLIVKEKGEEVGRCFKGGIQVSKHQCHGGKEIHQRTDNKYSVQCSAEHYSSPEVAEGCSRFPAHGCQQMGSESVASWQKGARRGHQNASCPTAESISTRPGQVKYSSQYSLSRSASKFPATTFKL